MKIRRLLLMMAMCLFAYTANAQSAWEVGPRFGFDQWRSWFAIDATIPLGAEPRLHPTIYMDGGGIGVGAYFEWMFGIGGTPDGFRVFPGAGPEVLIGNNGFDIGIAGVLGAEYAIGEIPLTVGFDWRPAWLLTEGLWRWGHLGISARFRLGEINFK